MSDSLLLITGADGYVAQQVSRYYLEHSQRPLLLWLRASDESEFVTKRERARMRLGQPSADRVTWSWGDLREAEPFRRVDPNAVTDVLHTAAVTRFSVDADTARQVNTEGAAKFLRFAESCRSVRAVAMLSTLYATGLHTGVQQERPYDDSAGFANHYEHSKWRAEQAALRADLPVRVLRLATVIADNDDGTVSQYNAFHNTLKLFYYGLLSLLPGEPDTPLYFVTGDFAAQAIAAVLEDEHAHDIYHVAHTRAESSTLGDLVETSFERFGQAPDFASRRVLPPLWTDRESFDLLAGGLRSFGGQVVNQALGSITPFARQLFVTKDVRNDRLRSVLPSYQPPDTRRLIARTCERLVETRWGRVDAA